MSGEWLSKSGKQIIENGLKADDKELGDGVYTNVDFMRELEVAAEEMKKDLGGSKKTEYYKGLLIELWKQGNGTPNQNLFASTFKI